MCIFVHESPLSMALLSLHPEHLFYYKLVPPVLLLVIVARVANIRAVTVTKFPSEVGHV